jgi:hypothetical protein
VAAATAYVLDSGVFIQAARYYYAFDVVPAFWDAIIRLATHGAVLSIDRVKQEIDRGKDDLTAWANANFHQWFDSTNQADVLSAYANLMRWVQPQSQFTDAARRSLPKPIQRTRG